VPGSRRSSDGEGVRRQPRRRWRAYKTASGRCPVEEFIDELSDGDAAAVFAGMEEVRVDGDRVIYRVRFAEEGTRGRVLLSPEALKKKNPEDPGRGDRDRQAWASIYL
jgi:hypothetical protein